jgi:hypothetical protein
MTIMYWVVHIVFLISLQSKNKFRFQVAALFHIGTTKSHPPIPEHLSIEAKDFLLKCLQEYVSLLFISSPSFL